MPSLLPTPTSSLMLMAVIGASFVGIYAYFNRSAKAPLPPGPPCFPLIGNLLHYPPQYPWFKFTEWKALFGGSISFYALFTTF